MKHHLVLFFTLAGLTLSTFGQTKSDSTFFSKNSVFIELFGNCIYGSINYDRILLKKNSNKMSLRFGILPYYKVTSFSSATIELNYFEWSQLPQPKAVA